MTLAKFHWIIWFWLTKCNPLWAGLTLTVRPSLALKMADRGSPGHPQTLARTSDPSMTSLMTWAPSLTPGPAVGSILPGTSSWSWLSVPSTSSGRRGEETQTYPKISLSERQRVQSRGAWNIVRTATTLLWIWIHLVWKHALSEIITLRAASVKTGDTGACRHLLRGKCEQWKLGDWWQHQGAKTENGVTRGRRVTLLLWKRENNICTFYIQDENVLQWACMIIFDIYNQCQSWILFLRVKRLLSVQL